MDPLWVRKPVKLLEERSDVVTGAGESRACSSSRVMDEQVVIRHLEETNSSVVFKKCDEGVSLPLDLTTVLKIEL